MADDGRERTIEELIEEIMSSDQWYWGFYNESNMIKTKYKIGEKVYAIIPDSGISFTPAKIKELKVVAIKYTESYIRDALDLAIETGSRKTVSELYTNNSTTESEIRYYLADAKHTFEKAYALYENEIFESIEKAKESLKI